MKKPDPPPVPARVGVLDAITAPLGFFVLALAIVESFLAAVLIGAGLDPADKPRFVWVGLGMFALVVGTVAVLVWFKPTALTYDKHAHLIDRGKIPYGGPVKLFDPGQRFDPDPKRERQP